MCLTYRWHQYMMSNLIGLLLVLAQRSQKMWSPFTQRNINPSTLCTSSASTMWQPERWREIKVYIKTARWLLHDIDWRDIDWCVVVTWCWPCLPRVVVSITPGYLPALLHISGIGIVKSWDGSSVVHSLSSSLKGYSFVIHMAWKCTLVLLFCDRTLLLIWDTSCHIHISLNRIKHTYM